MTFPKTQSSESERTVTYTVKEAGKLWCEILSCAQDEGASITFTVNDGEYTPGMEVVADSKIKVTFKFTKYKVTGLSPDDSIFGAVVKSE